MPLDHTFSILLVATSLVCDTPLFAQTAFPVIHGETVGGLEVVLPQASPQGFTIIAMAYGKKAQPLLETWYGPAYSRFVNKQGLFADSYHADLFLVPMFVGLNKSAYGSSMNRLRKYADPDIARRVVFFKGDAKAVIEALGMTDRNIPYFFVLDKEGHILARVSGAFSVDKLDALEAPML
jgi:hypothetical protein